jgi:hypothetical protein
MRTLGGAESLCSISPEDTHHQLANTKSPCRKPVALLPLDAPALYLVRRYEIEGPKMKVTIVLLSLCISAASLTGCTTLSSAFSTENVMKIHQGMSSNEIQAMFGSPKSVRSAVCGASTGKPWNCTTWEYGDFSSDRATFTFSGEHGSYILNDFKIDRQ